jgi:CTP synthase (UTP-ammonia lyase)
MVGTTIEPVDSGRRPWIAIIGDRIDGFEPQAAIPGAIDDAAKRISRPTPDIKWIGTEGLADEGPVSLEGASAVWCAPGAPFRSLLGTLVGIRWAREAGVPFLGTCAGFQYAVIEYARTVLGHERAAHAEHKTGEEDDLFIDELLCSVAGKTMEVDLVDAALCRIYGTAHAKERYYCRFGLNPKWRNAFNDSGPLIAGVDAEDGDVRLMRLLDHPFYVLTLFVPQTRSSPGNAHPLIQSYLRAALSSETQQVAGAHSR